MSNRKLFLLGLGFIALVGLGLCIGGIFIVPLMAPGGIILGAAIGLLSKEFKKCGSQSDNIVSDSIDVVLNEPQIDEHHHHDLLFRYQMVQAELKIHEGNHEDGDDEEMKSRNKP